MRRAHCACQPCGRLKAAVRGRGVLVVHVKMWLWPAGSGRVAGGGFRLQSRAGAEQDLGVALSWVGVQASVCAHKDGVGRCVVKHRCKGTG